MGKQKTSNPTSPQVVATISSLLLLLVSVALGFYFVELRGPGFRTLLSGSQASEIFVLLGGLGAVLLTGHLAVANAARSTQGTAAYRKLTRRLAEIDYSDPQAVQQFDAVPELRDLASILVAEKEQGHQLQDTIETVRGEGRGLVEGMERSLKDLGKMREDHASELGRKVATLWNIMIERVQDLESRSGAPTEKSGAVAVAPSNEATESRLRMLEERVAALQGALGSRPERLLVTEDDMDAHSDVLDDSPLVTGAVSGVVDLGGELDPIASLMTDEAPQQEALEVVDGSDQEEWAALDTLEAEPMTEDDLSPVMETVAPVQQFEPTQQADAVEEGVDKTFSEPDAEQTPTFTVPWREQVEEAQPVPTHAPVAAPVATSASPGDAEVVEEDSGRTYSEWGGAGFASLTQTAQGGVGFGMAPESSASASRPASDVGFGSRAGSSEAKPRYSFGSPPEAVATSPRQDDSKMQFPEFGPRRAENAKDHVEVTYEGSTPFDMEEELVSFETVDGADDVDDGVPVIEIDDDVVDLKSLGALETNE